MQTRTRELEAANTRLAESLQQLRDTQGQLLFADRLAAVGRLAAGVGHGINNPLSYILSNLRYIRAELERTQRPPSPPERQERLMAAIRERARAPSASAFIVQELRMLSRPDDVALGRWSWAAWCGAPSKMARAGAEGSRPAGGGLSRACPFGATHLGWARWCSTCSSTPRTPSRRAKRSDNEVRVTGARAAPGRVVLEVRRHRLRYSEGEPGAHLRAVLHHQAHR